VNNPTFANSQIQLIRFNALITNYLNVSVMKILHISAECYPAAKAGGLGDVVGALPKYLTQAGVDTAVIIPKYRTKWLVGQTYKELMRGSVRLGHSWIPYSIEECYNTTLGFKLYVVNCPQYYDRSSVYTDENGVGYRDEVERSLVFQQAVIHWVMSLTDQPKVLHCHDHHTGLVPFMIKYCPEYQSISHIPTVFTIHNGEYQGAFSWQMSAYLPYYESAARPMLDWNGAINPMASAIKCCWKFTTVSAGYLDELRNNSGGLEWLMNNEWSKASGILNGIDNQVWNPATDHLLENQLKDNDVDTFKQQNKDLICDTFGLRKDYPLIVFIGRLVGEKGADLLPGLIGRYLYEGGAACFAVLGTGDPSVSDAFVQMSTHFGGQFGCAIMYDETLSHLMYAGADFLIMPSRVEPCGLNQMYALRYGTIPIVRSIGGLRDTVQDIGAPLGGSGIRFAHFSEADARHAIDRAMQLWWDRPDECDDLRERIMTIDNSWENSTQRYLQIYQQIAAI
jgi:starch synthase